MKKAYPSKRTHSKLRMIRERQNKSLKDWLVFLLCLIAGGLSLWLTVQKVTGRINTLIGCGNADGCENVLGGKWAVVFGVIPVSAISFVLYLGVMVSIFMDSTAARWFRVFAAFLILFAAVWFTSLQFVVIETVCVYCMTMHSLGVLLALVILFDEQKKSRRVTWYFSCVAALLVAGLALIQHFGPQANTHRIDSDVRLRLAAPITANNSHTRGSGRLVSFFDGKKSYRLNTLPHLGSVNATYVIVKYFDYTCESCGQIHEQLMKLQADHATDLTVIVLPVPLNRSCNPHLPLGVKDHSNACDLARIALRVWLADPENFPSFHNWLFKYYQQPLEVAEAKAYSLVGEVKMNTVDEEVVEALLRQNVSDYASLVKKTPVMPKLLLKGSTILQGVPRNGASLEALLIKHLEL